MTDKLTHLGGWHGTSTATARKIEAEGFESRDRVLCLTPMDDEGLERAMEYGALAAKKLGESSFGVVGAVFGSQEEVPDAHGRPQIEIPGSQIGSIMVMRVTYFDVDAQGEIHESRARGN